MISNIKKINIFKNRRFTHGFTMIELLIAIAVFLIGIMAAFSLSLYNLNTTKENYNRVVAADLAREGLEIVRNIRDSNWLAREANFDRDSSTPEIELYDWDTGFTRDCFSVDYRTNTMSPINAADLNTAIGTDPAKLYIDGGFYDHNSSALASFFRRAICIKAICWDDSSRSEVPSNNYTCAANLTKIGLQVTARVQYTYGSQTKHIDTVENIYNWRQ